MADHAAVLLHAQSLFGVDSTVIRGNSADTAAADEYGPGVANVSHVKRETAGGLTVRHCHSGSATTIPSTEHGELAIHFPKGRHQRTGHISRQVLNLSQDDLVQLRFAIVYLGAAAVAVVDSEEAPDIFPVPCALHKGVDNLLPVLHVRPELPIGILRRAHQCCRATGATVSPRRHRREGRERPNRQWRRCLQRCRLRWSSAGHGPKRAPVARRLAWCEGPPRLGICGEGIPSGVPPVSGSMHGNRHGPAARLRLVLRRVPSWHSKRRC